MDNVITCQCYGGPGYCRLGQSVSFAHNCYSISNDIEALTPFAHFSQKVFAAWALKPSVTSTNCPKVRSRQLPAGVPDHQIPAGVSYGDLMKQIFTFIIGEQTRLLGKSTIQQPDTGYAAPRGWRILPSSSRAALPHPHFRLRSKVSSSTQKTPDWRAIRASSPEDSQRTAALSNLVP